ncbi:uncharacterized protein N7487_004297 [Penicillium crustosum]|uniref:uncharacterized protein n=1 Tax=Penicillium crustosum TaxID=36656 RepID=UPI002387A6EE|nr:uncharacterized protein N7487_004297 [Penicillium crustosum]KAJ5409938.1 hypothetical protein N7487_004297 [Penicillium crustosum]
MAVLPTDNSSKHSFRAVVPPPDHPKVKDLDKADVKSYSDPIVYGPKTGPVFSGWLENLKVPFLGVTVDGTKREGLFELADENAPVEETVRAATRVRQSMSPTELAACSHEIDSDAWRKWSNPELLICTTGLRLENLQQNQIELALELLRASLSADGFKKATAAMEMNEFLGEITNAKPILNRHSYQLAFFGIPSTHKPWGFSLYGHHLCLNIFIVERQMVISPVFVGAEPNIIDAGPLSGLTLCSPEEVLGLKLMQTLPPGLQKGAQIYPNLEDEKMPSGRWHPADERHLCGAFQDNRVVPTEGIKATSMPAQQQELLLKTVETFLVLLPPGPLAARMQQIRQRLDETFFSWIGGFGDEDPFYYRIQSPVIVVEFDHHRGVFLLNTVPEKFHIHTVIRTPNGNDYGRELLRQFQARSKADPNS